MQDLNAIREDLTKHLSSVFPITSGNRQLVFDRLEIPDPVEDIDDENTLVAYRTEGKSYTVPIQAHVRVEDTETGKVKKSRIKLGDLPLQNSRGVSIIGGKNYVAYNQMRLAPGVYPAKDYQGNVSTLGITRRGKNFTLERGGDGDLKIRVGTRAFGMYPILRLLGADHNEAAELAKPIPEAKIKDVAAEFTSRMAYDASKVTDPVAWSRDYFTKVMDFDEIGDRNNRDILGLESGRNATKDLLVAAARRMKAIEDKKDDGVDKDDLAYQEVLNPMHGLLEDMKLTINKERYAWNKRLQKTDDPKAIIRPQTIAKAMTNYFNSSQLINHIDERNPLQTLSFQRRLTKAGEGGVSHAREDIRELKDSHFGFIDPVVSPESGSIGITLQLAKGVRIDGKRMVLPVNPVVEGKVDRGQSIDVDPWEARRMVVALPDKDNYKADGSLTDRVWARSGNKIGLVPRETVTHAFQDDGRAAFDTVLGLIPFQQHNDSTRLLMGTNMLRQALDIAGKEAPLVRQTGPDGRQLLEHLGSDPALTRVVKTDTDGVVTEVTPKTLKVLGADGQERIHRLYNHLPLNGDSFITNTPLVKPGDAVRAGQVLADGWYTKNGAIAPGANLRIGYMPWKGYNFEDGIVVSESLANSGKMNSQHLVKIERLLPATSKKGKAALPILKGRFGYAYDRFREMDDDGVVVPGTSVRDGDILVSAVSPMQEQEMSDTKRFLHNLGIEQLKDDSAKMPRNMTGKVVRVIKSPGPGGTMKVTVHIAAERPLAVGSKLSGLYGNKGVITHIAPDSEMPIGEDGKPLDVLLSPLGVPSRKNIGQLIELLASKIAEKTGKPYDISSFNEDEFSKVTELAKQLGISEKETLIDPVTKRPYETPVAAGKAYILRLEHEAATTKWQARGVSGPANAETDQAVKVRAAEKTNPQTMGEMETRTLIAHGADEVLKDVSTYRSGGLRSDPAANLYFMAGLPLPDPKTPQSFKALDYYTRAAGLKIVPKANGAPVTLNDKFQELLLVPAANKDVLTWSSGEIQNGKMLRATDLRPDPGGLFDETIFGRSLGEHRTRMGHISLPVPIPHPLYVSARSSLNPYVQLLGLKQTQIKDLTEGSLWLRPDTGELMTADQAEDLEASGVAVQTAGEALETLLGKVDPKQVYAEATTAYKTAADPTEKLRLASKARIARMLVDNDLAPTDLLFRHIPVLPRAYRAVTENTDGSLTYTNMNTLYKDIVTQAQNLKVMNDALPAKARAASLKALYHSYAGLIGTEDATDVTGKAGGSIMDSLSGKSGLVRRKMLGRAMDMSGRTAITVDPKLDMDSVGIPRKMALTLYEPFLLRNLRGKGLTPEIAAAKYGVSDLGELIKKGHPVVMQALDEEVAKRDILVNRAPTLHKYGIVAAKPHLTSSSTIEMNPFVMKGLGADLDGDTIAIHVPLSDKAAEQARKTMRLSANLINPGDNSPAAPIYMEMLMGLAYATDDKVNPVPVRVFDSSDDLVAAIRNKDIRLHDPVKVGNRETTAGKAWVNSTLPETHQKWTGMWTSSDVKKILSSVIADGNRPNTVATYNNLKDIGFEASTIAPVSLSVSDYRALPAQERLDIMKQSANPVEYTANMQKRIKKEIGNNDLYRYMILSGARNVAGQMTHIMGTRGVATRGTGKAYEIPALRSYADGLAMHEYNAQAHDSRRGVMMRSWKTFEPGAMTRRLWHAVADDGVISMDDCGEAKGFEARLDSANNVLGHILTQDVVVDDAVLAKAGTPVTQQLYTKLKGKTDAIMVRSPLTCRAHKGICAKCFGQDLNTQDFFPIGTSVGTIAAQAFGEPMTQGVLSSFHTGTKVTEDEDDVVDSATANMIKTLSLARPTHPAALARIKGTVVDVNPTSRVVSIQTDDGKILRHTYGRGVRPVVEVNAKVGVGDSLTSGKPDMLEYAELVGPKAARPALYKAFTAAASKLGGDVPSRHIQTIAKAITRKVRVEDPGGSPLTVGDVMDEYDVAKWNRENAGKPTTVTPDDAVGHALAYDTGPFKAGQVLTDKDAAELKALGKTTATITMDPIHYTGAMVRTLQLPRFGSNNWFSQISYEQVKEGLTKGSVWGMSDNLNHNKAWIALGRKPTVQ